MLNMHELAWLSPMGRAWDTVQEVYICYPARLTSHMLYILPLIFVCCAYMCYVKECHVSYTVQTIAIQYLIHSCGVSQYYSIFMLNLCLM